MLPTGVSTNLSALEVGDDASCPLWHLESITIAGSKDLAVAVFWVGGVYVCVHSRVVCIVSYNLALWSYVLIVTVCF